MGFGEKIRGAIFKIKGKLLAFFIMWLIVATLGVTTFSIAVKNACTVNGDGSINSQEFFMSLDYIMKPLEAIELAISPEYSDTFWGIFWKFNVIYFIAMVIGLTKAVPKHEFEDMEHGSSDWCVNGEQYRVLSRRSGIVLAEKNYLPVDKRGNVNVLVVRRFWCW